jgi:hypothetical protein
MSTESIDSFRNRVGVLVGKVGNASTFARRYGLSGSAVRNYLNGGGATRPALQKISEQMSISPEWLIKGTGRLESSSVPRCCSALLEISVPKCLTFLSYRLKGLA